MRAQQRYLAWTSASALMTIYAGRATAQPAPPAPPIGEAAKAAPGASAVAAAPPSAPKPAAAPRRVRLSIAFSVNGSPAGEVTVETDGAGNAAVDSVQLLARIGRIVAPAVLDKVRLAIANRAFAPVADLRSDGFALAFDLAALQLRLDVPLGARSSSTLSIRDDNPFGGAAPTAPAGFAAGATITLAQRLQQAGPFSGIDRDPARLAVRGFFNQGGKDGVYLVYLGGVRENDRVFRRGTTLFHDDVDRAIRYSIGDLDPRTTGAYQTSTSLLGIGVERAYQDIQPFRNLRPSGRGALTLERPSRVDVLVNGALYRTLTLAPGHYDLRDFPFLDGLNDVQLAVSDDSGRSETLDLSFFSDTLLLDEGVSLFSANIGVRQDDILQYSSTRYRRTPTVSGYYVRGVSDALTLGGSVQADKANLLATAQVVIATPIGIFGAEAALDRNDRDKVQGAALISYRLNGVSASGRQNILAVDLTVRTKRFSPMTPAEDRANPYRLDVAARYQRSLGQRLYATAGFGYSDGIAGVRDAFTANAGLSRSFGRLTFGGTYSHRRDDRGSDDRFALSLAVPLGRNQSLRTGYNSHNNRMSADYALVGYEGLDQTSAEVSVYREDDARGANVAVEHYFNRARATLVHDYQNADGARTETSDIGLSFGIGFADGQFALGRDADRGFTIVTPHSTLGGVPVEVVSRTSLGPTARSGALGPALVPVQRSYQPDVLEVRIPDLPNGYDIGAGRLDILPGAASGYRWQIGSAASHTLVASLVDGAGKGVPYLAGTLRPLSGAATRTGAGAPVDFFTNRAGRLVAQKVAPGRYAVVPAGASAPIGEFVVAEDALSIVNAGTLVVKDYQP